MPDCVAALKEGMHNLHTTLLNNDSHFVNESVILASLAWKMLVELAASPDVTAG
jgi:hypothetical protein